MSRMSRTSIAKARRTLALPPEIVRTAEIAVEIAEAIVAAAEGVREVADVGAVVADVTAAAVVAAGMAVAGTAGEGTNLPADQLRSRGFRGFRKRAATSVAVLFCFRGTHNREEFSFGEQEILTTREMRSSSGDHSRSLDYRVPCSAAENIADMRAGHSR